MFYLVFDAMFCTDAEQRSHDASVGARQIAESVDVQLESFRKHEECRLRRVLCSIQQRLDRRRCVQEATLLHHYYTPLDSLFNFSSCLTGILFELCMSYKRMVSLVI